MKTRKGRFLHYNKNSKSHFSHRKILDFQIKIIFFDCKEASYDYKEASSDYVRKTPQISERLLPQEIQAIKVISLSFFGGREKTKVKKKLKKL